MATEWVSLRQAELLQIRGTEPEGARVLLGGVVAAVHHALPGDAVGDAEEVRKLVDRRRERGAQAEAELGRRRGRIAIAVQRPHADTFPGQRLPEDEVPVV